MARRNDMAWVGVQPHCAHGLRGINVKGVLGEPICLLPVSVFTQVLEPS